MTLTNKLFLFVLVGFVVAGGSYRQDNRLTLQRTRRNVLNFACGAYGNDGSPNYYGQQTINYSFNGLPSWLSASGSTLFGTPPANENGPWYVSVNYRGGSYGAVSGSSRYELACDGASSSGYLTTASIPSVSVTRQADPVTYSYGYPDGHRTIDASENSYVVLVPIITTNTRTVYEKQPDTIIRQDPVSCDLFEGAINIAASDLNTAQNHVNSLNSQLADAQALLDRIRNDLAAAQAQVNQAQSAANQANADLDSCHSRQAAAAVPIVVPGNTVPRTETYTTTSYVAVAVGGYSSDKCGSINVDGRGTGYISSVGVSSIIVSGLGEVNFGDCSERNYRSGRNSFNILDSVRYETYQWAGKKWARRVTCQ